MEIIPFEYFLQLDLLVSIHAGRVQMDLEREKKLKRCECMNSGKEYVEQIEN